MEMNWINVNAQLPPTEGRYLFHARTDDIEEPIVGLAWFHPEIAIFSPITGGNLDRYRITHWMEMPGVPLPRITYGNREGGSPAHFEQLERLASSISIDRPEAYEWTLWYDAETDYHRLGFQLDRSRYEVRSYKIFTCVKDEVESNARRCDTWRGVALLFRRGDERKW